MEIESKDTTKKKKNHVTLKAVAEHLGLTPGTVSAVWNNSAASRSIPEHTRKRILEAVRHLKYRPNFMARSLRVQRTYTIGVILEEIGDAYGSMIVSGIEEYTRQKNYFFLTVAHRHDLELLETYSQMLLARGVEGFLTVDTSLRDVPSLPTVAVAGHRQLENVTNIILDHRLAAMLGLKHLQELGHREIAFLERPAGKFGLRSSLECHLRSRPGDGNRNSFRARGAVARAGFYSGARLSIREGIAGAESSFHGAVCLQRYFRHRSDAGISRSGLASAGRCFGGWV